MISEFKTVFAGENNEIECTVFDDDMLMIKDGENDSILITKDQLVEILDKLKGDQ